MSYVSYNTRKIINERGLKQCAVATKAGIENKKFNSILTGRMVAREGHILAIAKALDVTPNELLRPPETTVA